MKKWVIKQPYKGEKLEIWEYIDTVEAAVKIPYVAMAINKYGADRVVPLAMNDRGGYHYLPADSAEIVKIIECDEKPKLSVYEQYPVNSAHLRDGWMSPDGTTFSCGAYGHIDSASSLCDELRVPMGGSLNGDEALINAGWIKIMNGEWFGSWRKVRDDQIRALESLGIRAIKKHLKGGGQP